MPNTLSKGYQTFNTGEKSTWWTGINSNFTRLNGHTHDGIDSQLIPTNQLTKGTSNIPAGSWSAVSGVSGLYSQVVTLPAGYTMGTLAVQYFATGGPLDGCKVHLGCEKVSSTSYRVYCNDNTLSFTAVYA